MNDMGKFCLFDCSHLVESGTRAYKLKLLVKSNIVEAAWNKNVSDACNNVDCKSQNNL